MNCGLIALAFCLCFLGALADDCSVFNDNHCAGDNIVTADSFEANRWYTPEAGSADHIPSFQDYSHLAGHCHVVYTSDLQSAVLEVKAVHRDNSTRLTYVFDGVEQDAATKTFTTAQTGPLQVSVRGGDGTEIALETVDFSWNREPVLSREGDFRGGQKGAVVELFGWPHTAVAQECEALAELGYMGVKMFPVMEQVMSAEPFSNVMNPWYFMYQPVSYRLEGRMGTRDELRKAVNACRALGVRVYADAVINHMVGGGNDANAHHRNPNAGCTEWGPKNSSLSFGNGAKTSAGPSPSYTQDFAYTKGSYSNLPPSQEFPAANYGPTDFHCERALNSWTDPLDLNAGWLTGLVDLNTERTHVRERVADYLTDLLSIGFSGVRIDAAKHISPDDLSEIFAAVARNMGGSLPSDFVAWLEVLLGGESDLLMCDQSSSYSYGAPFEKKMADAGLSTGDIAKIKIWNSGYPKEPDKGFCGIGRQRNAIQNDDHDQQTSGSTSRDMGNAGCVLVEGCAVDEHRNFEVELFTSPPGAQDNSNDYPLRMVLSSYYWPENQAGAVPDGLSDCALCQGPECDSCRGMPYTPAYEAGSCGYDSAVYTRPHRDLAIVNAMRQWVGLAPLGSCPFSSAAVDL